MWTLKRRRKSFNQSINQPKQEFFRCFQSSFRINPRSSFEHRGNMGNILACFSTTTVAEPVKKTLYDRLGGAPAIDAAVDKFYAKVLDDKRVNFWFEKTNMPHQVKQQKAFLTGALGGPNEYKGRTMDRAHAKLVKKGLNDSHFDAIAEILQNTLLEMGVDKDLVAEVIAGVAVLRDQILCKGKYAEILEEY